MTRINKPGVDRLKIAKRHYVDWGIYEGRNRHCAQRITDQQAQCYLDKNDDLRKKFGDTEKGWIAAKEHWYTTGWKEGRDHKCTGTFNGVSVEQPYLCAQEGQDCKCEGGTIFFTKNEFSADRRSPSHEQASWEQAINYAFLQTDPIHGHLKCDAALIGDMAPGFAKQCFCEKKVPAKPVLCAKEGEPCACPAGHQIFYGARSVEGKANATFLDLVDAPYAVAGSPSKGSMRCSAENFNGDPLPGRTK